VIVIDTNVTSELMRHAPSQAVSAWLRAQNANELYTTAVTVAEIRYGISRLPDGNRKDLLTDAAVAVFSAFSEMVLPFDVSAAAEYAGIVVGRERAGRPINGFDALIASICRAHHAVLATRNVKDFEGTGIDLTDPWDEGQ
jgi:toxin FitB